MTDIKEIAATYAARIFDRMELCRGSAILKSDIEREVEMALKEYISEPFRLKPGDIRMLTPEEIADLPGWPNDIVQELDCESRITPKQAEERGIPMGAAGYIWVDDEAAKTAVIGKPYSVLQAKKDFHEAYERTKQYLAVNTVDPPEVDMTATEVRERLKESFKGKRNP
jgi:hypothetical protein